MDKNRFDEMLELVARSYDTTPEIIRAKISRAIEEGQQSPDPQVRALWNSVPHTGDTLTLSEFVFFLAQTLQEPFEP